MKTAMLYLCLPPLIFGMLAVVLPPLSWFMEFIYRWIVHDDVIAIGNLDRSVRASMRPASWFATGAFWGLIISLILFGWRLWDGRWPHKK